MVKDLFPEAVILYGYEKGAGYVRITEEKELEVGKGYWIFLNKAKSFIMTGQEIPVYTHPVKEDGWYIIGGCTSPAKASIDNGTVDVIYKYIPGSGYKSLLASENLEPGKGYWVLLNDINSKTQLRIDAKNP